MRTVTFHANFVGVNGEERDMKGHNSKTINRNKSKLCFFLYLIETPIRNEQSKKNLNVVDVMAMVIFYQHKYRI